MPFQPQANGGGSNLMALLFDAEELDSFRHLRGQAVYALAVTSIIYRLSGRPIFFIQFSQYV